MAQPCPGGRVVRIGLHRLLIEAARDVQRRGIVPELVGSKVKLIRLRTRRYVLTERPPLPSRQGQRQGFDDAPREIVLKPKEVADWNLRGIRPQESACGGFDELHVGSELIAHS